MLRRTTRRFQAVCQNHYSPSPPTFQTRWKISPEAAQDVSSSGHFVFWELHAFGSSRSGGPIGPMLLLMERPLLFADATGSRHAALWAESNKLWLRNPQTKKHPTKMLGAQTMGSLTRRWVGRSLPPTLSWTSLNFKKVILLFNETRTLSGSIAYSKGKPPWLEADRVIQERVDRPVNAHDSEIVLM